MTNNRVERIREDIERFVTNWCDVQYNIEECNNCPLTFEFEEGTGLYGCYLGLVSDMLSGEDEPMNNDWDFKVEGRPPVYKG